MAAILRFPDPRKTTEEGIVAVGGNLEPESLILAYSQGIFPWPIEGLPLPWFCPPTRAILEWDQLHIPQSLAKARRKSPFRYTVDQAFTQVIQHCAKAPRPGQDGTWISLAMKKAYTALHHLGQAHSVEVWEGEALVAGLYGVSIGGTFAAESMYHQKPNASKLALLFLMETLHSRGLDWIDIQMLTPHLVALGAREIQRDLFLEKLAKTQNLGLQLF